MWPLLLPIAAGALAVGLLTQCESHHKHIQEPLANKQPLAITKTLEPSSTDSKQVPGPLGVLGAVFGFHASRRLKKRIKDAKKQ